MTAMLTRCRISRQREQCAAVAMGRTGRADALVKRLLPLVMLMALLLLSPALAIGISPAKFNIDYTQGGEQDLVVRLVNREAEPTRIIIYAQGELEKAITVLEPVVDFAPGEAEKTVRVKVRLPELSTPGQHEGEIVALQLPRNYGEDDQTTVSATAAVISKVVVNVPYPGKYVEPVMFVQEANGKVVFTVSLSNHGKEPVESVAAEIRVLSSTNQELARLNTDSIALPLAGQGKVTSVWDAKVNPGPYHAIAMVRYDNEMSRVERDFNVGTLKINVASFDVGKFRIGEIAKMLITVKNEWSDDIEGLYADLVIRDKQGHEVITTRSASVNVPALGQVTLTAFWDTNGIPVGNYDAVIVLHYADKTTEQPLELAVNIDSITPISQDITANAVAGEASPLNRDTLMFAAVIILVLVNVMWLFWFRKKK